MYILDMRARHQGHKHERCGVRARQGLFSNTLAAIHRVRRNSDVRSFHSIIFLCKLTAKSILTSFVMQEKLQHLISYQLSSCHNLISMLYFRKMCFHKTIIYLITKELHERFNLKITQTNLNVNIFPSNKTQDRDKIVSINFNVEEFGGPPACPYPITRLQTIQASEHFRREHMHSSRT